MDLMLSAPEPGDSYVKTPTEGSNVGHMLQSSSEASPEISSASWRAMRTDMWVSQREAWKLCVCWRVVRDICVVQQPP